MHQIEYDPVTVASIKSSNSEVVMVPSETSTSSSVKIEEINTFQDSFNIINLAEDVAVFHNIQKTQKSAINELKFIDKGISFDKNKDASKQSDPITVDSINLSDSKAEMVPSETSTSSSVKIEEINTFQDSFNIINLAEDVAVFHNIQKTQKSAINELKVIDNKGISFGKNKDASKQYDSILVAYINSSDSEVEITPSTTSSMRIEQINTLKDSFKDRDVTSNDGLGKLNSKYKKKNLDNQIKEMNAVCDFGITSKVNYRQNVNRLEHKLKHELCIQEKLIKEVRPTVKIAKLTPDQEKAVGRALGPGPAEQTLVEKFGLRIQRQDLQTLAGSNWLNDEVINFYMYLLMERSKERDDLPKVFAASTFFYTKLIKSGQAGFRRWMKKVDIFAHDLMVIPIHQDVHWTLSIIDFNKKCISFLNSMGECNQACLDKLLQYLRDEHKDKKGTPMDDCGWTTVNLKNIPQQINGNDCGMFACTFAEYSSRRAAYTFTQANMPQLRRKMACEILEGKLLL